LRNGFAKVHNSQVLDWNDLKYFLAVARAGSTIAAARDLGVNQSTVHRRLDELERRLGHKLVSRHPTGYRLTELGEELSDSVTRIEDAIADFERRVSAWGKEYTGLVKVTCPEALASRLMRSGLIDRFNRRYPSLHVEFVMSDRIVDLGKGQADIAIRALPPADNALVARKIADSPWAIYASRSYVENFGGVKKPEDINRHAVILFDGAMRNHHTVRWLRTVAPHARIVARADSLPALVMAAKSGTGLASMPVIIGENENHLIRMMGPVPDLATPFYLVMHRDMRRTPRVRAFFDYFIAELPVIRPLLTGKAKQSNGKQPARKIR
jgi:DNA-binding transcriptional LysR family regulator